MAAPTKGENAKTEVVSLRITKAERKLLLHHYGNERAGLRAIFNTWLKERT